MKADFGLYIKKYQHFPHIELQDKFAKEMIW